MARDRPPPLRTFGFALEARDLYAKGTECHSVPISLIPIIAGALQELTLEHAWKGDDQTIALTLAQIKHFIGLFGTEFTLCDLDCPPCPDTEKEPPGFEVFFVDECEDCDMGGCNLPYGALRWNGPVLEYRVCDEWLPVPGGAPGAPPEEPSFEWPDDIDETVTPFSACGKARAVADLLVGVGDYIWDNALSSPTLWVSGLEGTFYGVNFYRVEVYNAFSQALLMQGGISLLSYGLLDFDKSDAFPSEMARNIACRIEPYMDTTSTVDPDTLYDAITAGINAQSYGADIFANNFWHMVRRAIGKGDFANYALGGLLNDTADCSCPEDLGDIASSIFFTGTHSGFNTNTGVVLESYGVENGGRRFKALFAGSDSGSRQFSDFVVNIAGAQVGDSVTVRIYASANPTHGRVPANTNGLQVNEITPTNFVHVQTEGQTPNASRVEGADWVEYTSAAEPAGTPANIEVGNASNGNAFWYPDPLPDLDPLDAKRMEFYLEIVAVNGVRLPPIGP